MSKYINSSWVLLLFIFGVFGGCLNLINYITSNLSADIWRYLASSIIVVSLLIILVVKEKQMVNEIKSTRISSFQNLKNVLFFLFLIISVFVFNDFWIEISNVLFSLLMMFLFVLLVVRLLDRWRIPWRYEDIADIYINLRTRINFERAEIELNFIFLIIFIFFSLFILMKMDIPFWWKLAFIEAAESEGFSQPHGLFWQEWHNYYLNAHNLLKIFFDGYLSNFILGIILTTVVLFFVIYLMGAFFVGIFAPVGISIKIVSALNLKKNSLDLVFTTIFTLIIWTIAYFFYVKLEEIFNEIWPFIFFVAGVISFLFSYCRRLFLETLKTILNA
jgi:hypothetical protein